MAVTMWDIGGQDRLRPLWKHYFAGTHGVIFVVDSNDTERIPKARCAVVRSCGRAWCLVRCIKPLVRRRHFVAFDKAAVPNREISGAKQKMRGAGPIQETPLV